MDIYIVKKDVDIQSIILDKSETIAAKWVSKEELQDMIKHQKVVRSVALSFNLLKNKFML